MLALLIGGVLIFVLFKSYGAWKRRSKIEELKEIEKDVDIAIEADKISKRIDIKTKQLEENNGTDSE